MNHVKGLFVLFIILGTCCWATKETLPDLAGRGGEEYGNDSYEESGTD